ncbi:MAG TPA: FxsB family cyclophane-forming radical SAM/SPASM peptide maturase [Trebonia sp.]|nr:FxsB family cyclophane-forming radical SAM/SPASM peptide maturase [Trebonia sp.]
MGQRTGSEWPTSLDVSALRSSGWSPLPFREFVVKVHSRCDLACDYCYMYEMEDQSWRDQPRAMSPGTVELTARRIGEHTRTHGLDHVTLILHGGEPLLAGREIIAQLVTATRQAAGDATVVDAAVQTNAVGLSDAYLEAFDQLGIRVGISIDGDAKAHDRHRRFPSGRGSYLAVSSAVERLRRFPHLYSGLLATIDLRNDPVRTYQSLASLDPPRIDFLLPHGTWARPPAGRVAGAPATPYADWLIAVFDHWYPRPTTRVRLFEEVMQLLLGGSSTSEVVGLSPARMVVVETDGSIAQEDTLRVAFDGAPATGLHVARHSFDIALGLPEIAARQMGERALAAECRDCDIRRVCGGGLYSHRYREGTGFLNPSVYCPDLMALIGHIRDRMATDIQSRRHGRATG